jgi:hypothetical protein
MMAKHSVKCDHEPECSNPNQYATSVQYIEIWDGDCKLVEIVPDQEAPHDLVCTECTAPAEVIIITDAKKQRDEKAQE